jgi:transketolase
MMLIGEAFAALGHNTWVSTFCPFFDWKVLRRIAVGQQERLEAMASDTGWLSDGHGLDLTFLATAANFETRTNGATHMGNDDSTTFQAVAHLRIIDVSCPQQLLAIMRWIMGGNRGLVYVRVMRTPSPVIYGSDYVFEFGRASVLRQSRDDAAVIVSSGRQVHESLAAAARCQERGVHVGVIDMPSSDESMWLELLRAKRLLVIAEQNDGYLLDQLLKVVYRHRAETGEPELARVMSVNTLGPHGRPWFIHSATYEELVEAYALAPAPLANAICARLGKE